MSTDVVTLQLTHSWPREFRPGQFLYVRFLTVRYFAFLQSHPLYIASWKGNTVSLLIERRHGFTSTLRPNGISLATSSDLPKAIFEGPFGGELLESYGTAMLFATGIGIAAQLPYVRHLLEGHQRRKVKAQRIYLFWEIESEGTCPNTNLRH